MPTTWRGNGESILVIEDDDDVRALSVKLLTGLGYAAQAVRSADEARIAPQSNRPFDLILSDVVLTGGTSGPDFAREVRRESPAVKILFMSGYPADKRDATGLSPHDTVLLNKPFLRQELATALRDALSS